MFSGIVEEIAVCADLSESNSVKLWDGTTAEGAELVVRLKEGSEVLLKAERTDVAKGVASVTSVSNLSSRR